MAGEIPKMADPHGILGKIRGRMSKDCAVRKSRYCDNIIAKRLQGIPLQKIRDWLFDQNPAAAIPVPTLARNLTKAIKETEMDQTIAEKMAEGWGGEIEMDLERTILGQILIQRRRVDDMTRAESDRKKNKPGYMNPRIRQEMETLMTLIAQHERLRAASVPEEDLTVRTLEAEEQSKAGTIQLSGDGETALLELILSGKMTVSLPTKDITPSRLELVRGSK